MNNKQPILTKREAYRQGLYVMGAPPVCTARWSESDWIRFVQFTVPVRDDESK